MLVRKSRSRDFAYTPTGQRATVVDGHGTTTQAFDPRDRPVRRVDSAGRAIEYTYDPKGNLLSRVTASQSLVYAYDARDRLVSVTSTVAGGTPRTTRYTYDEVGLRTGMIAADGTTTAYTYDRRNRLVGLVQRTAAAALLFGATYTVDATGLRTAAQESDASGVVRTLGWTYDALKRLVGESIDHRDATRDRTSAWTYDRVGNRLTQSITTGSGAAARTTVTTSTYDTNDRLTQESASENGGPAQVTTFAYDAQGNTLTKTAPGGVTEYTWDDANRLVEQRAGVSRTTYRYNADGLRIGQTTFPATGSPTRTDYLVDPSYAYANVIERFEGSATAGAAAPKLAAVFTFGEGIVGQTSCTPTGTSRAHDCPAAQERIIHADGFGSTRYLTTPEGAITDRIDYDAFGNEIARSGDTEVEHLYRGERWDANVAAYDLRARLYSPGNGRFLTQDDFAGFSMDPRSLHKYAYAHGDPVGLSDPSGYSPLMSTLQAVNVVGNLYTVASIGFQIYSGNYVGAAKDIAEEIAYSKMGGAFGKRVANYTKKQVGLFYRAFEKTLRGKPRLGLDPSPSALSHNMEVFGVPKPTGTQAHHIVGRVTQAGRDVQDRLKALGIDVNSPMNGVFLPGCGSSKAIGMVHCGKHTAEYEVAVARRLAVATDKASAINILSDIRNELLSNSFTKLNIRAH